MPEFSLTHGGPFYTLSCRAHLVDRRRRPRWYSYSAVAWFPIVIAALVRWGLTGKADPVLTDPTVHTRFLICMPLMVLASRVLEVRVGHAMHVVRLENLAPPHELDAIQARTIRLRDSRLVEGALALVAIVGGHLVVWVLGARHFETSFEGIWYASIALPMFQFLMLRWFWHWVLWTYVLVRLARLPLATNALHSDEAAGLGILDVPVSAFAVFVAGISSLADVQWTTQILEHGGDLTPYIPTFFGFAVIATVVACGPLFLFTPKLVRARNRDLHAHHVLATEFVRNFRDKWMHERPVDPHGDPTNVRRAMFSAAEFQSLNDLHGAFQTTDRTGLVPIGSRALLILWAAAVVPLVPVILTSTPLSEVAKHLGKLLLGGVPID